MRITIKGHGTAEQYVDSATKTAEQQPVWKYRRDKKDKKDPDEHTTAAVGSDGALTINTPWNEMSSKYVLRQVTLTRDEARALVDWLKEVYP